MFNKVNPKQSFPELEKEIINYWKENNIFEKSVETRNECDEFNFFDGPPFATGTPHYGHILAGTIKDVIPRYQTMLGKKVERRFGWDCHGLPIENIVEKKLGISGKDDIEGKIGVHDFNEECRANVFGYVDEWKKSVERMGRWVDMENDYKTMDTTFMESVWWVFKTIYDKGLIYEGNRIVPYCPRCTTPLSNFEVNQGYKDKQSKTVTVKFKVQGSQNKYILAWTTTPWTLYSNLGLAVGTDIMYSEILDKASGDTYVLASEKVKDYYKNPEDYTLLREYAGTCIVGMKYEPLFSDFDIQLRELGADLGTGIRLGKNAYSVVAGHHVTTETGVGIVHIAPAYGEDDFIIGEKEDLGFVAHIDNSGKSYNLLDKNGINVFELNDMVIASLKEQKLSVNIGTIVHSYPHCWRCDTPLIYRGISAWYVAVEKIRDKMVASNEKITWVPDVIKHGRFGKWLEGAKDWNISRNRYWGSAIPVWQSEDKKEEICIGSIEQLYELNKDFGQIEKKEGQGELSGKDKREHPGVKYFYTKTGKEVDIHKHFVDEILIKNPKTGNTLKRIPEVLDCWFESGSMPYASKHFPFENKDNFKFPADFIAEGLDQTRGWFYTLIILSTALYDNTSFLNCIVNGIILAEDGKKMSKSLKNYTDPNILMDKFGADAMRFYLMNSPVVEAQDLRFSDAGVEEVVKKVILPLWNTYSFFTTYANIDNFEPKIKNIYYVRHGRTDNNDNGIVNGGDDDIDLNEFGVEETKQLAKQISVSGIKFDVIVTSPMTRTKHTTEIIKNYLGYEVEVVEDEAFREQSYGEFRGMTHAEIKAKYGCKNDRELTKVYRNNSEENIEKFEQRVIEGYKNVEEKFDGKNVLIISHGGVFRCINKYLNNLEDEVAYYGVSGVKNSKLYKLPSYKKSNNLDKWIISELNILTGEMTKALDNYRLNDGAKSIPAFMDNLTNWYVRRSRKRFWGTGMTQDKQEAYNTLYEVLVEVSKLIAPYMPFVSEYIFKNLTDKESVHLELYPVKNPAFIFKNLSQSTAEVQNIITLGLAARANAKIRVRQPLEYVKVTQKLDEYFEEIVCEELNVKEVKIFSPEEIPSQICKPNARLIGPKFGGDVKFIISEAKAGNFTLLENGGVKVGAFELNPGEFEIEFVSNSEAKNSNEILESGNGKVVALSTNISEALKLEGYARDIVRHIQESRKEADFNVDDRIEISIEGAEDILNTFGKYIETETLSQLLQDVKNPDLQKEVEIEDLKIILKLKK
ncbi:MAG: isoleucine--tRNA ligase [Candidatus Altimarinota bacterium]